MLNLCVTLLRVSGKRSRRGMAVWRAAALSVSVVVESGWLSFDPSR